MSQKIKRWMPAALLGLFGLAGATPALPAATFAEEAVRDALAVAAPVAVSAPQVRREQAAPAQIARPRPTPRPAQPAAQVRSAQVERAQAQGAREQAVREQAARAAQARARAVQEAQAQTVARGTARTGRSAVARATAYNSTPGQTDSTPFITATGTRVRSGVVALSRDLLRVFPYGSKVMIEDLSGRYTNVFRGRVFSVEDTMAARKTGSVDIWMGSRSQAIQFGARQVRVTAVR